MAFVLLAWILLAPLGAWAIGAAIGLADKRSVGAARGQAPGELPCRAADEPALNAPESELATVGA